MERIHDLGLAPSFTSNGRMEDLWAQACRLAQDSEVQLKLQAENKAKHSQIQEGFAFGSLEEEADNSNIN